MNKLLLLELPLEDAAPLAWLYWQDGSVSASGELPAEQLADLAQRFGGVPCYAIIDGQAVSHHRIVLPKGGRVGLTALPFQLEERLCTDLESVHFAHSTLRANEPADVLVIDRGLMAAKHALLRASGLALKGLLPDYAVLPANVVLLDGQRASIRLERVAVGLDIANFPLWWQLAAGGDEVAPEVAVYTAADWPEQMALPAPPRQHYAARLEALARYFQPWPVNLLSGEFAIRDERKAPLRGLRWPLILLALVLALHWASLAVDGVAARAEAARLESAMEELYLQTFPGSRVVNARSQMRSQLNALEGGTGSQSQLLPWLEKIAAAARQPQGIELGQMSFEDDPPVMKLQFRAESFEVVDAWVAALSAQGLSVSRGAFNQEAGSIGGQLILRGGEQ